MIQIPLSLTWEIIKGVGYIFVKLWYVWLVVIGINLLYWWFDKRVAKKKKESKNRDNLFNYY